MSGAKGNKKLPVNFKYFELFIQMVSLIGYLMYSCILYRVLSNQIWVLKNQVKVIQRRTTLVEARTMERLRSGSSKNKTIFSSIFCLVIHILLKRLMGLVYFCFTILQIRCLLRIRKRRRVGCRSGPASFGEPDRLARDSVRRH